MRKKGTATRKRSALRWLTVLCLLVLFCHWTGLYGLTLRSVLRQQGRDYYLEKLTLVDSVENPYETDFGTGRVLAAENGSYLLLGLAWWTPWRGWQPGGTWRQERTDGAVDTMVMFYSWDFEGDFYPLVVFGYVNDPQAVRVTLRWADGQLMDAALRTDKDGERYFLETCGGDHTVAMNGLALAVLNRQGELLEERTVLPLSLADY